MVFSGIIITSILYSLAHFYIAIGNYALDYLPLAEYFILGIVFALLRIKNGLIYSMLAHLFYNVIIILFNNKIIDLFFLDYLKSETIFWANYFLVLFSFITISYKLFIPPQR